MSEYGVWCNPVLLSVILLLILSALRLNVLFSLVISSVFGGVCAALSLSSTLNMFTAGLGNGANIAMNYALLGTLSISISRSGITEWIAQRLFAFVGREEVKAKELFWFKYALITILVLVAISSQNLIPIHIAFIPILIPPLLQLFNQLKLDRRMIACILTFGLITPYMVLPLGFGQIYLNEILIKNINLNGMAVDFGMVTRAMLIPALGMVAGLLIAVFISYRKPRLYNEDKTDIEVQDVVQIKKWSLFVGIVAIIIALIGQIYLKSMILGSVAGVLVFIISGVIRLKDTQDVFTQGVHLMGGIGLVMMAASGFAEVMKGTNGVAELVQAISAGALAYRGVTVFVMLVVGLIITMGIGSSFSTVPLIATIYVPICIELGISPMATLAIIGTAGALGDAGSPVSESVLGPTAGLNAEIGRAHV